MRVFRVSALILSLCSVIALPVAVQAQGRVVEVVGTDNMKFSVTSIAAKAGETLRYRCDRRHVVRCVGSEPGTAMMVCILKAAVME